MSLQTRLGSLITAIGADIKTLTTTFASYQALSAKNANSGYAGLSSTAHLALAQAVVGSRFQVLTTDGTTWTYEGVTVTARPSARTDIFFVYVNTFNTNLPSWAIAGDFSEFY